MLHQLEAKLPVGSPLQVFLDLKIQAQSQSEEQRSDQQHIPQCQQAPGGGILFAQLQSVDFAQAGGDDQRRIPPPNPPGPPPMGPGPPGPGPLGNPEAPPDGVGGTEIE